MATLEEFFYYLSLPIHTNYGGILQAYALQTVLERMGHLYVNKIHVFLLVMRDITINNVNNALTLRNNMYLCR